MIDITGINKAALLAALFNSSKPMGLGFYAQGHNTRMTAQAAQATIDQKMHMKYDFDYLQGRVMKIDISGNAMDPGGYDRDNGPGAALKVVEAIRSGQVPSLIPAVPQTNLEKAASSGDVEKAMEESDKAMSLSSYIIRR